MRWLARILTAMVAALALISLATAVWSSRLMVRGHPVAEVERFDRRVLIIAVGGYVLANVLIFWAFLG